MKYTETKEQKLARIKQSLRRIDALKKPKTSNGLRLVYSKPRTMLESLRANIERNKAKEARLKVDRQVNNNNIIWKL
jgi:hypothetical protein